MMWNVSYQANPTVDGQGWLHPAENRTIHSEALPPAGTIYRYVWHYVPSYLSSPTPLFEVWRAKPGAHDIAVTIGDFATTTVDGTFSLAYLVFNTIMNLTTQAAQVACFRNAAAHLEPGGCFVVEVGVPDLRRLPPGETFRVFSGQENYWGIDEYDIVKQGLVSHHVWMVDGAVERFSAPYRYVWPSELDLMAELAGMRLRDRWSGWEREAFTSESDGHVSVWQKAGA